MIRCWSLCAGPAFDNFLVALCRFRSHCIALPDGPDVQVTHSVPVFRLFVFL